MYQFEIFKNSDINNIFIFMSTSAICWFHFIDASDWPLALFYNNKRVRSSKKKRHTLGKGDGQDREGKVQQRIMEVDYSYNII